MIENISVDVLFNTIRNNETDPQMNPKFVQILSEGLFAPKNYAVLAKNLLNFGLSSKPIDLIVKTPNKPTDEPIYQKANEGVYFGALRDPTTQVSYDKVPQSVKEYYAGKNYTDFVYVPPADFLGYIQWESWSIRKTANAKIEFFERQYIEGKVDEAELRIQIKKLLTLGKIVTLNGNEPDTVLNATTDSFVETFKKK